MHQKFYEQKFRNCATALDLAGAIDSDSESDAEEPGELLTSVHFQPMYFNHNVADGIIHKSF